MASAVKVALIARVKFHYIGDFMTPPEKCTSLDEVRAQIDRLDEEIVQLIGRRAHYVRAAARFKTSEAHVAAPDRQKAMLAVRREWAEREGVDPELIEDLYRRLVAWFVKHELEHWKRQQ
jgi:isochorismate pyruvate lyase